MMLSLRQCKSCCHLTDRKELVKPAAPAACPDMGILLKQAHHTSATSEHCWRVKSQSHNFKHQPLPLDLSQCARCMGRKHRRALAKLGGTAVPYSDTLGWNAEERSKSAPPSPYAK